MVLSYSKWDALDDSDEEGSAAPQPVAARGGAAPKKRDTAMEDFFSLPKDASVAQIQASIAKLDPATRDDLLRHEKGGLLKRMMDLDPSKSYEAGEIFGAPTPAKAPAAKPPAEKTKKPALKPTAKKSPFSSDRADAAGIPSSIVPADGGAAALEAAALSASHPPFSFVRLPADQSQPIESQLGYDLGGEDCLPMLLAPLFRGGGDIDARAFNEVMLTAVEQAKATAVQQHPEAGEKAEAAINGPDAKPTIDQLESHARGGVCEAWPLASASDENGWMAVKLYIDEVGALRKRPRNARAEALVAATGQVGLTIHGDAFVGRIHLTKQFAVEKNLDFTVEELDPEATWLAACRRDRERDRDVRKTNHEVAKRDAAKIEGQFTFGEDDEGLGRYTWTQAGEDVEVRILKGIPLTADAKRRIKVGYGAKGDSLLVSVDGQSVLRLAPLYGRVQPFECSWSLEVGKGVLTVNLEKVDPQPWLTLTKPAEKPDGSIGGGGGGGVATSKNGSAQPPAGPPPSNCAACKPTGAAQHAKRHEH